MCSKRPFRRGCHWADKGTPQASVSASQENRLSCTVLSVSCCFWRSVLEVNSLVNLKQQHLPIVSSHETSCAHTDHTESASGVQSVFQQQNKPINQRCTYIKFPTVWNHVNDQKRHQLLSSFWVVCCPSPCCTENRNTALVLYVIFYQILNDLFLHQLRYFFWRHTHWKKKDTTAAMILRASMHSLCIETHPGFSKTHRQLQKQTWDLPTYVFSLVCASASWDVEPVSRRCFLFPLPWWPASDQTAWQIICKASRGCNLG